MSSLDPIVQRRRLGSRLRLLRERAGKTQPEVQAELHWSKSKINRIETGVVGVTKPDLLRLLESYGVSDQAETKALLDTGRETRRQSSWGKYRHLVSSEFYTYLAHEAAALSIRSFQPSVVPGLLQTDDYAESVTGWRGRKQRSGVREMVELRTRRQELLERTGPGAGPSLSFLMSEAVVSFTVGNKNTMRAQIEHLIKVAQRPDVLLRVIPFDHGIYPHWREPYVLLEVGDRGEAGVLEDLILYLEVPRAERLISEATVSELPAEKRTELPSLWLNDYSELEGEVNELVPTLTLLELALRRLGANRREETPQ